jgi:hypothetical protein
MVGVVVVVGCVSPGTRALCALLASWAKSSSSVLGVTTGICIESVVDLGLVAVAIAATRRFSSDGKRALQQRSASRLFVAVHDVTRASGDSANCCRR